MQIGNDLYHRTITYDYQNEGRRALMEEVWSGTPWMVNAYTGRVSDDRWREMMVWCQDQFGPEAHPIHGMPGTWKVGGATVFGWTWFGFDTPEKLDQFIAKWPAPPDADEARDREGAE